MPVVVEGIPFGPLHFGVDTAFGGEQLSDPSLLGHEPPGCANDGNDAAVRREAVNLLDGPNPTKGAGYENGRSLVLATV